MSSHWPVRIAALLALIVIGWIGYSTWIMSLDDRAAHIEASLYVQDQVAAGDSAPLRVLVAPTEADISPSGHPVEITLDGDSIARGSTDEHGHFSTTFHAPEDLDASPLTLQATVGEGSTAQSPTTTVALHRPSQIMVDTDKPRYQPGESITLRAMLRAPDGSPIEEDIAFQVLDPQGIALYDRPAQTNPFGMAQASFPLADVARHGEYRIVAHHNDATHETTVDVDAYELPEFDIELQADRDHYGPGDPLELSVQADYFFGQPVADGSVAIMATHFVGEMTPFAREATRLDDQGSATVDFELPDYSIGSAALDGQGQVAFEVTVGDGAGDRESATFAAPIVTEELVINAFAAGGTLVEDIPNQIWFSTESPDGQPLPAEVTLYPEGHSALSFDTDHRGLAAVELDYALLTQGRLQAQATADSDDGTSLNNRRDIDLGDQHGHLSLVVEHPSYEIGDTVDIDIHASRDSGPLFVELLHQGQTRQLKSLHLQDHRAAFSVDITPDMEGFLDLRVSTLPDEDGPESATTRIPITNAEPLEVLLTGADGSLRPGDRSSIELQTLHNGEPVAASLALDIVDQSVFAVGPRQWGMSTEALDTELEPHIQRVNRRALDQRLRFAIDATGDPGTALPLHDLPHCALGLGGTLPELTAASGLDQMLEQIYERQAQQKTYNGWLVLFFALLLPIALTAWVFAHRRPESDSTNGAQLAAGFVVLALLSILFAIPFSADSAAGAQLPLVVLPTVVVSLSIVTAVFKIDAPDFRLWAGIATLLGFHTALFVGALVAFPDAVAIEPLERAAIPMVLSLFLVPLTLTYIGVSRFNRDDYLASIAAFSAGVMYLIPSSILALQSGALIVLLFLVPLLFVLWCATTCIADAPARRRQHLTRLVAGLVPAIAIAPWIPLSAPTLEGALWVAGIALSVTAFIQIIQRDHRSHFWLLYPLAFLFSLILLSVGITDELSKSISWLFTLYCGLLALSTLYLAGHFLLRRRLTPALPLTLAGTALTFIALHAPSFGPETHGLGQWTHTVEPLLGRLVNSLTSFAILAILVLLPSILFYRAVVHRLGQAPTEHIKDFAKALGLTLIFSVLLGLIGLGFHSDTAVAEALILFFYVLLAAVTILAFQLIKTPLAHSSRNYAWATLPLLYLLPGVLTLYLLETTHSTFFITFCAVFMGANALFFVHLAGLGLRHRRKFMTLSCIAVASFFAIHAALSPWTGDAASERTAPLFNLLPAQTGWSSLDDLFGEAQHHHRTQDMSVEGGSSSGATERAMSVEGGYEAPEARSSDSSSSFDDLWRERTQQDADDDTIMDRERTERTERTAPRPTPSEPEADSDGHPTINILRGDEAPSTDESSSDDSAKDDPFDDFDPSDRDVRLREHFPETLFSDLILTDDDGQAEVDIEWADSITTWTLDATGISASGALGSAQMEATVFQPFFISAQMPTSLTRGDRIRLPLSVYNHSDEPLHIRIEAQDAEWATIGDPVQTLSLDPGEVGRAEVDLHATTVGDVDLQWEAHALSEEGEYLFSDALRRQLTVHPDGQAFHRLFSGRLHGTHSHDIPLPQEAIADSHHATLEIHPGHRGYLLDGLDALLDIPTSSFETAAASLYPAALILEHLEATDRRDPALEREALTTIATSYQRLLSFQVDDGAYSLFGDAPATPSITGFGLRMLSDIDAVYAIDDQVLDQMLGHLEGIQHRDGYFLIDPTAQHIFGIDDILAATAFSALNIQAFDPEAASIDPAITYLDDNLDPNHASTLALAYTLRLFSTADAPEESRQELVDELHRRADTDDERTSWQPRGSYSNRQGQAGLVETTALASDALLSADADDSIAHQGLDFLVEERREHGWGTTQATVAALQAFNRSSDHVEPLPEGQITLRADGELLKTIALDDTSPLETRRLRLDLPDDSTSLTIDGPDDSGYLYRLQSTHHRPWDGDDGDDADSGDDDDLSVELHFDHSDIAVDDLLGLSATIDVGPTPLDLGLVQIPIPPGFEVEPQSLDEALRDSRLSNVDNQGDHLVFNIQNIRSHHTIDLQLRAQYPIEASSGSASIRDYSDPDRRTQAPPQNLSVR